MLNGNKKMQKRSKENWFERNKSLSTILIALGIIIIIVWVVEIRNNKINHNAQIVEGNKAIQESKKSVWEKFSGYSVDECLQVCEETYDIQAQVDVCWGNCWFYGKPSEKLDDYVNTVKNQRK